MQFSKQQHRLRIWEQWERPLGSSRWITVGLFTWQENTSWFVSALWVYILSQSRPFWGPVIQPLQVDKSLTWPQIWWSIHLFPPNKWLSSGKANSSWEAIFKSRTPDPTLLSHFYRAMDFSWGKAHNVVIDPWLSLSSPAEGFIRGAFRGQIIGRWGEVGSRRAYQLSLWAFPLSTRAAQLWSISLEERLPLLTKTLKTVVIS